MRIEETGRRWTAEEVVHAFACSVLPNPKCPHLPALRDATGPEGGPPPSADNFLYLDRLSVCLYLALHVDQSCMTASKCATGCS